MTTQPPARAAGGFAVATFVAICVAAVLIGLGAALGTLIFPSPYHIHWNIFAVVELVALFGFLVVSVLTYFSIQMLLRRNEAVGSDLTHALLLITWLSSLVTALGGLFAAAFASVPHLHLASLCLVISSFIAFDTLALIFFNRSETHENQGLLEFKVRLSQWLTHTNLPTLFSFVILYALVSFLVFTDWFSALDQHHTYHIVEAFTSGAAAFHLVLHSLVFLAENRQFYLKA